MPSDDFGVFAVLQLLGRGLIGSRLERRVMQRATRYAKSGRVSIAYQVVGDGPTDLILIPGFVSHVELAWEEPRLAHFLGRLAAFSRLVLFDKRGTGMSDRSRALHPWVNGWTIFEL
jgi:pimeloyl-ACP methyl ester carboxylesterase